MSLAAAILLAVTLQRLGELVLARRNTERLRENGAVEVGRGHYPVVVAFHAAWLAMLWWLAPGRPVEPLWLTAFAILQLGRAWVLLTLGRRWTTRILVVPGETLVGRGPYRYLRHPNYLVVACEIPALPFAFGLFAEGALFGLAHLALLAWRIRAEDRALASTR